ncbi:MAG: A/G-specific adenine glycosylase [Rhodobacteraceae bacterium]|nr:A/G-specific adenine glycosylase [Paracoccaceae bacterium]
MREPAREILDWYDRHARVLPWRVPPGSEQTPDPYRVWLSEVMLQQTTVAAVKDYFRTFTERWPRVQDLAEAPDAEVMAAWAGLGYYARARNLLRCARVVARDLGGVFPDNREALSRLPGIGPYTSAAIAAIAFDRSETVVDGNVERVMARLFAVETPLPAAKGRLRVHAAELTPTARPGDYAQGVMDLGATVCTPRRPACALCPWNDRCLARRLGMEAELPRRSARKAKPVRFGHVYVARREDGAWLLEKRPAQGLLGGMLGWPGSDWCETLPEARPPASGGWQRLDGEVRHTFTHFQLRLTVWAADLAQNFMAPHGSFHAAAAFRADNLPTLMRKVHQIAEDWFDHRNEERPG